MHGNLKLNVSFQLWNICHKKAISNKQKTRPILQIIERLSKTRGYIHPTFGMRGRVHFKPDDAIATLKNEVLIWQRVQK